MKRTVIFTIMVAFIVIAGKALARDLDFFYSLSIDQATVQKGYTIKTPDKILTLGILPEVLEASTTIEFKNLSTYLSGLNLEVDPEWARNLPPGQQLISDIYEFNILDKVSFNRDQPLILELAYNQEEVLANNLKKLYFWNGTKKEWQPLPSQSLNSRSYVRSLIHLPYARLAIFANSNILEVGQASWYGYRGCDCAASPDYPKDSLLRVINLANDKSVIVKVNDYGPDRSLYPERVIDLDKVAFQRLAPVRQGIIKRAKVELIKLTAN